MASDYSGKEPLFRNIDRRKREIQIYHRREPSLSESVHICSGFGNPDRHLAVMSASSMHALLVQILREPVVSMSTQLSAEMQPRQQRLHCESFPVVAIGALMHRWSLCLNASFILSKDVSYVAN